MQEKNEPSETKEILYAAGTALLGAGLIAFNWWYAITRGVYYDIVCILGPCLLVYGIATLFVPEEHLGQPPIEGSDPKFVTQSDEFNKAGWVVFTIGMVLGLIQLAMMESGRFR